MQSSKDGFQYPVDSGSIGLVPAEIADTRGKEQHGRIVEFSQEFQCTADYGRNELRFGNVRIDVS